MHGLQNRLNILYEMANSLGMINILDKSGISLFINGGHIIRRGKINYGQNAMFLANTYK